MVREDILPLLEEYCYEDYATLAKILGRTLVDERDQRIHQDLFDPARQDDLIQALKAIDPNLDTSATAVASEAQKPDEEADEDEASDNEDTVNESL